MRPTTTPTAGISPEREDSPAEAAPSLARQALMWAILALMVLGPPLAFELYFMSRFDGDFPGSSIVVQGAWRFMPSPYRAYQNSPRYVRRLDGVVYRYNNYGLRNEEDLVAKEPDEFRIFVLGGSVAYGERALERGQWQLISGQKTYPTSETIGSHLQRILGERMAGRTVRVFTAATVAYRVHQSYLTYLSLLRTLEPDLVVTIDGANEDYSLANPYDHDPRSLVFSGGGAVVRALRQHSYTMLYLAEYFRSSALFDRFTGRGVEEFPPEALDAMDPVALRREILDGRDAWRMRDDVRRGLMGVYDAFSHAAASDGVPVLFCVQPMLPVDEAKSLTPTERRLLAYWHLKGNTEAWGIFRLAEMLDRRSAGDSGFRSMSLLDVFEDFQGEAYTDLAHLTPRANEHVARRLAERILDDGTLRRGGPAAHPHRAGAP